MISNNKSHRLNLNFFQILTRTQQKVWKQTKRRFLTWGAWRLNPAADRWDDLNGEEKRLPSKAEHISQMETGFDSPLSQTLLDQKILSQIVKSWVLSG